MIQLNRKKKQIILWMSASFIAAFAITLLIPSLFIHKSREPKHPPVNDAAANLLNLEHSTPVIPVFLSHEQRVDKVPLETYVRGVVAAEMPIDFELEALKAQALAARTYIVRRILEKDTSQVPVKDAVVTDTVAHQAYLTEEQLAKKWNGEAAKENLEKLNRAVEETKDQILLYDNKPINAVFFSTSNGYTENSEDYWGVAAPYLRSVPSPWDAKLSPRYKETVRIPYREFLNRLGFGGMMTASGGASGMKIIDTTAGHRIKRIRIGGKIFSGKDVREKLNLNSAQFDWKIQGSDIEITTTGYGHGVGMSQWGANGMAKEGKTAADIVRYYYTGIQIGSKNDYIK